MNDQQRPIVLGAVAYDPKVVTIWEGFKVHLGRQGLAIDYMLFSNYESQVEAHLSGTIDLAWNSPLAWVRARRMAEAGGRKVWPLVMRDTDRSCTSRSSSVPTTPPLGSPTSVGAGSALARSTRRRQR